MTIGAFGKSLGDVVSDDNKVPTIPQLGSDDYYIVVNKQNKTTKKILASSNYPTVNTFADLPSSGMLINDIIVVRTTTGVIGFRKLKGLYIYTGTAWERLSPSFHATSVYYDNSASGLTAINVNTAIDEINNSVGVDWTSDQGGTNIHTGNYTNTTYSIQDGELSKNNLTDALKTKLDYISITQSVDLDTMESNILTNNSKVTNATHSGDVTGSAVLTIANDAVTNAKLANIATGKVKGRTTSSTGDVEDIDIATTLKTALTLVKGDVGLGSVPNTDCTNASNIASGTLDGARLPSQISISGNVGIGTTTPRGTGLHVNADMAATGIQDMFQAEVKMFYFGRYNRNSLYDRHHYISSRVDHLSGGGNYISFNIDDGSSTNGTSHTRVLTMFGDGNVGIGVTTPKSKLDVEGGVAIGATYSGTTAAPANGLLVEGNVGIGTTSPGTRLHVHGRIDQTGLGGSTFLGENAGLNTSANADNYNVGIGYESLKTNSTGEHNTAVGHESLYTNTTGGDNTAIGKNALHSSISNGNTAVGFSSLNSLNNGGADFNVAMGWKTLNSLSNGIGNTVMGTYALNQVDNGNRNVAVGQNIANDTALIDIDESVFIGALSRPSTNNATNEIVIGYNAIGNGSNTVRIGNDSIVETILTGNVGIGTTTPGSKLTIAGSLSKTSGSFDIPHPDPKKIKEDDSYRLRHYFIETPSAGGNIYKYQLELKKGVNSFPLPDYFSHLNKDTLVWVSPFKHFGRAWGKVNRGECEVIAEKKGMYNILLFGDRKDEIAIKEFDKFGIEYTSKKGEITKCL